VERFMDELHHFIAGKRVMGTSGRFADVHNPATGEVIARTPLASEAEVARSVDAAKAALPAWAETPPLRRARVLFKFKELLEANLDKLAKVVTAEHGKTLEDSRGSCARGIEVVEFACGVPHLLKGEFTQGVATGVDSWSVRQPVGVCAGITPFNFPVMVPMWMFPIAIACGNSFILKPSERDPSVSLLLAELFHAAGLPAGIFNVVNGDKDAVGALLRNRDVRAVSFVGSTPVAEQIYHLGSANNKRVQALGGAKNHIVVMPDAAMEQTTDALMAAAYGSAGERCMAASVVVAVGDKVGDALVERLAPRVRGLKVGPGMDPGSEMGPLISRQHLERVKAYVQKGVEEGAELVVDGRSLRLQGYEKGYFLGGCLFDRVTPAMTIYKEEIFGPVLSVVRVQDLESAAKLVNEHEFGNGTAIFTRDGDAAREFSHQAQIGMVGVNVPVPVPMAFHSFGGWKRSLFGDHHMHGLEGVRFFTKMKTITTRWPEGLRRGVKPPTLAAE
jgi:malonate-semialdehyde dehydrogenase (acetylating) / methylmalonate-semialdehyde dehydrogenase